MNNHRMMNMARGREYLPLFIFVFVSFMCFLLLYRHDSNVCNERIAVREEEMNGECAHRVAGVIKKMESNRPDIRQGDDDDKGDKQCNENNKEIRKIPVVLFTYERAEYLRRSLDNLLKYVDLDKFTIFVSQDGSIPAVSSVIQQYSDRVSHLVHSDREIGPVPSGENPSYHHIAAHYHWGIEEVFRKNKNAEEVVILEEDIEVAPDFFEYMEALRPLLHEDESLLCVRYKVSGFNDNGKEEHVVNPISLYRSDFFPGLGWMMTRNVWNELSPKWPPGYWDDWLRQPQNRRGRSCIRPEVSRTVTFGQKGVSQGQFFEKHLAMIKLNDVPILWKNVDLSDMYKDKFDVKFSNRVRDAEVVDVENLLSMNTPTSGSFVVMYSSLQDFRGIASKLGIMVDEKSMVFRGAYKGVVPIRYKEAEVFIAPQDEPLYITRKV